MPIRRPKPVPRPRKDRMDSISDEERARIQQYDAEMAAYNRQRAELRKQQEAEYAARRKREADKASRMFASFDRAADQLKQQVNTAKSFDVTTAVNNQSQRKYDQATPYRLLLKSLPYVVPMSAAAYSLAIDGARAYKYLQQSAMASNGVRNWIVSQAFRHPNGKIWTKLLNSATNAMTKPRFNSLLNIGKKQQLVADGIGVGFDGFQSINQTNQGNYMNGAMNATQGGVGVLGILGTLGKLPRIYNNAMNLVRPASNGLEVVDDALDMRRLIK